MFCNFPINDNFFKPPIFFNLLQGLTDDKSIRNIATNTREKIFDFDYPFSNYVNKEEFEILFIKKFLTRRIGTETYTSFKINLEVKLNEIMPFYSKILDNFKDWNIFEDGEKTTENLNANKTNTTNTENINVNSFESINSKKDKQTNTINNTIFANTTSENSNTEDLRNSDTPQNLIEEVQNGNYVTNYNYNKNNGTSKDVTDSVTTGENTLSNETTDNKNTSENKKQNIDTTVKENKEDIKTILKTQQNKLELYTKYLETKKNIYEMIFKDLDCLFYQLI